MSGLSVRTVLVIQANPNAIWCIPMRNNETGLYGGQIWLKHGDIPHELLIEVHCQFESSEIAQTAMTEMIRNIEKIDMQTVKNDIRKTLEAKFI